jgi:hypothetical protein
MQQLKHAGYMRVCLVWSVMPIVLADDELFYKITQ